MGSTPHYYLILVLDIEQFGRRTDPTQRWLRERLYAIIETALQRSGIGEADIEASCDRGDGCFMLIRATVSKLELTGPFITALQAELRGHSQRSSDEAALRVRVALHAGEVSRDARGWVGEALNTACRLVDLDDLRATLAVAHRSGLALAVSADWHAAVVKHNYPELPSSAFRQVSFHAKEVSSSAWLCVPGYDEPPRLGSSTAPSMPPAPSVTKAPASEAATPPVVSAGGNYGRFAGAVFQTPGRVYGGNHYEGIPGQGSPDEVLDEGQS